MLLFLVIGVAAIAALAFGLHAVQDVLRMKKPRPSGKTIEEELDEREYDSDDEKTEIPPLKISIPENKLFRDFNPFRQLHSVAGTYSDPFNSLHELETKKRILIPFTDRKQYGLHFQAGEAKWILWKTYQDFVELEKALSEREEKKGDIAFPRILRKSMRGWWGEEETNGEGVWPRNTEPPPQEITCPLDEQAGLLEIWLQALLADETIRRTKEFQAFIRYQHRKTPSINPMSTYSFACEYYDSLNEEENK